LNISTLVHACWLLCLLSDHTSAQIAGLVECFPTALVVSSN
jgi:hypothetical protein